MNRIVTTNQNENASDHISQVTRKRKGWGLSYPLVVWQQGRRSFSVFCLKPDLGRGEVKMRGKFGRGDEKKPVGGSVSFLEIAGCARILRAPGYRRKIHVGAGSKGTILAQIRKAYKPSLFPPRIGLFCVSLTKMPSAPMTRRCAIHGGPLRRARYLPEFVLWRMVSGGRLPSDAYS
jgi:hypothetical protein